jgi:ABC-type uncharacterized transport system substrate-binding protein
MDLRRHATRERGVPDLAAELVRLKVNVIVAFVTQAALSAKSATGTIPIVMVGVGDPVQAGLSWCRCGPQNFLDAGPPNSDPQRCD